MNDVIQQDKPYALPFDALYSDERAQEELIHRMLRYVNTARLVEVLAVHANATAGKPPTVDIQPLALPTDTAEQPINEAAIYGVPVQRMQGGNSAVVLDPVVGDIGMAIFMDRDHSAVVAQASQQVVGSQRKHSEMDAFYVGGALNKVPTQYVKLTDGGGIQIVSTGDLLLQAAGALNINVTGSVTVQAALWTFNVPVVFSQGATGNATGAGSYSFPRLQVAGIQVDGHHHGGVTTGSGTSGPMVT